MDNFNKKLITYTVNNKLLLGISITMSKLKKLQQEANIKDYLRREDFKNHVHFAKKVLLWIFIIMLVIDIVVIALHQILPKHYWFANELSLTKLKTVLKAIFYSLLVLVKYPLINKYCCYKQVDCSITIKKINR